MAYQMGHTHSKKVREKMSLSKLGNKNPMFGKKFSQKKCEEMSRAMKEFWSKNLKLKEIYKKRFSGQKSPQWIGDKIGRAGIHNWIKGKRGLAKNGICKNQDKTCKGELQWSNKSQKYLRRIYDWQILCASHHSRYDKHLRFNGLKTRFQKGLVPWNKGLKGVYKASEETKRKMGLALKGKKRSIKTKMKISQAITKWWIIRQLKI